jgi:hypothetical protein
MRRHNLLAGAVGAGIALGAVAGCGSMSEDTKPLVYDYVEYNMDTMLQEAKPLGWTAAGIYGLSPSVAEFIGSKDNGYFQNIGGSVCRVAQAGSMQLRAGGPMGFTSLDYSVEARVPYYGPAVELGNEFEETFGLPIHEEQVTTSDYPRSKEYRSTLYQAGKAYVEVKDNVQRVDGEVEVTLLPDVSITLITPSESEPGEYISLQMAGISRWTNNNPDTESYIMHMRAEAAVCEPIYR